MKEVKDQNEEVCELQADALSRGTLAGRQLTFKVDPDRILDKNMHEQFVDGLKSDQRCGLTQEPTAQLNTDSIHWKTKKKHFKMVKFFFV